MSIDELTIDTDSELKALKKDMKKLTKSFQKKYGKKRSSQKIATTDKRSSQKFDEKRREDHAHVCLMAKRDTTYKSDIDDNEHGDDCSSVYSVTSEVTTDPFSEIEERMTEVMLKSQDLETKLKQQKITITSLENSLKSEHDLVLKFSLEKALALKQVTSLEESLTELKDKNEFLKLQISEISEKLNLSEIESSNNAVRYNVIFAERTELYAKIKELEDEFLKRGQTDQTIHLNKPKEFKFYNPKEGIGFDNPHYLKKGISKAPTLYDMRYMDMGYEYKMWFLKASDEDESEDLKRLRTDKMQIPFNYKHLNESYDSREITLSDDYFHSYSEKELNQEPSSSNNQIYIPNLILEKKISELETDLKNKNRAFDDELNQFLEKK